MKLRSLNFEKLKDAIRLIIDQCEPHELGKVKLHKVLYYADMLTYLKRGVSITGATYRKRPFGPTCDAMLPAIAELESDGELSVKKVDYFGYEKNEFIKLSRRNASLLSDDEVLALKDVVDFVCRTHTASTISDLSHDIVWESVEMGQDIPYALAISWLPTSDNDDGKKWAEEVIESGVAQRRPEEMESGARGTLRARMAARA